MRVFLDANILFSAAKFAGAIRQLVEEIQAHGHETVADEYVIAEASRNLELKFPTALPDFEKLLRAVTRVTSLPALPTTTMALLLPEKDRPVLTAAIQHRCHVLLTGDKTHFGKLYGQTVAGVFICSPQGLAEILEKETERHLGNRPKRLKVKTRR
jgi:predicted nucleic acid-binding protein